MSYISGHDVIPTSGGDNDNINKSRTKNTVRRSSQWPSLTNNTKNTSNTLLRRSQWGNAQRNRNRKVKHRNSNNNNNNKNNYITNTQQTKTKAKAVCPLCKVKVIRMCKGKHKVTNPFYGF